MKLVHETLIDLYPIFQLRQVPQGDRAMPNLRLRGIEPQQESDSLPFPRQVSRIGTWQPKPLWETQHAGRTRHDAEDALDKVQEHLNRLAGFLDPDNNDRPTAA